MLFNLKLEKAQQNSRQLLLNIIIKNRFYLSIVTASIILAAYSFFISSVILLVACSAAFYLYNLYNEVSSISFDTSGLDFGLQDVINDLESR